MNAIDISMAEDGAVVDKVDFFPSYERYGYVVIGWVEGVFNGVIFVNLKEKFCLLFQIVRYVFCISSITIWYKKF